MSNEGDKLSELVAGWVNDAVELGFKPKAAHELVASVLADLAAHDELFAEKLDALVQFDKLIPGKLGQLLEIGDRAAFRAIVNMVGDIDELFKRDPVKVAARQKLKLLRKEARRARKSPVWHLKQALKKVIDTEAKASIERALARIGGK